MYIDDDEDDDDIVQLLIDQISNVVISNFRCIIFHFSNIPFKFFLPSSFFDKSVWLPKDNISFLLKPTHCKFVYFTSVYALEDQDGRDKIGYR